MSVWGSPHLAHYTKAKGIHDLVAIAELGVILKESFKLSEISESSKVGYSVPELKFLDFVLSTRVREDFEEKKE